MCLAIDDRAAGPAPDGLALVHGRTRGVIGDLVAVAAGGLIRLALPAALAL